MSSGIKPYTAGNQSVQHRWQVCKYCWVPTLLCCCSQILTEARCLAHQQSLVSASKLGRESKCGNYLQLASALPGLSAAP